MKKLTVTVISIVLVVALVFICAQLLIFGARNFTPPHVKNKAIIMLPGFLGSILKDDRNIYWVDYPIQGVIEGEPIMESELPPLLRILGVLPNEDGTRKYDMHAPDPEDERFIGGTLYTYRDAFNKVKEKYSKEYNVVFFQYDWMDNAVDNAMLLDNFINERGYDEVILLSHSMGGLVCDSYLALGEEQRNKVSLYCSFGSPHGGTTLTLYTLATGSYEGLPSEIAAFISTMIFDIARNIASVQDMLPNKVLLDSSYYKNAEGGYSSFIRQEVSKGEYRYLTDWDEIVDLYVDSLWAKYIDDETLRGEVKLMTKKSLAMQKSHYYEKESGAYEHVSSLVNTYYFVGRRTYATDYACIQINLDGSVNGIKERGLSDSTISTMSAACGLPLDNERVVFFEDTAHTDVLIADEPLAKLFEIIDALKV